MCVIDWKRTCGSPTASCRNSFVPRAPASTVSSSARGFARFSLRGGRVVNPAAADHRGDDLNAHEVLERVAVEDDEVREIAGQELAPPALVAGEPRRRDAGRVQRLLERDSLLGPPRRALVER